MNLAVKDGVVDLWGLRVDERERNAIRIAVEIFPGVKSVRDHLILIEPCSGLVVYSPDDEQKRSGRGLFGKRNAALEAAGDSVPRNRSSLRPLRALTGAVDMNS
jgi:hypothetical protein